MRRLSTVILIAFLLCIFSVHSFATSSTSADDPPPATAEESVFHSMGDDFLSPEDYVAFDKESISKSSEMFRNSIGSITNMALYGMLIVIGIFAVFEIIHAVAS